MVNKKGFTLIEVLAVISILSMIAIIVTISVESMLKKTDDSSNDIQRELIEAAAKEYSIDNCIDTCSVSINKLINEGYLESDKVNNIDLNQTLNITIEKRKIIVEYK